MATAMRPERKGSGRIIMIDRERDDARSNSSDEDTPLLGAGADENSEASSEGAGWVAVGEFDRLPWWRRPSVAWLLGPYFLFALAFGGTIVPRINLIVTLVCRTHYADQRLLDPTFTYTPIVLGGDNPQCNTPSVQRDVATFTLICSVLTGVLSALSAPKIGSLSDRYGRTRLLTVASFGGILGEVITIFTAKYPEVLDYHWLILGSFFDGVAGSFTAGSILASSYASDCTPPSKRGVAIGYLQACLFSGLAFGPILAGYFVKFTGSLLSIFYVALGCHVFFVMFIVFITPESLSKKRQQLARQKHQSARDLQVMQARSGVSSGVGALMGPRVSGYLIDNLGEWCPALLNANPFAPLKVLAPGGRENRALKRNLIILACIDVVILSAAMGSGTSTLLYVEYIFDWGTFEASRYVSLTSFIRVIVLLGFLPLINYFFRVRPLQRQRRDSGEEVVEKNAGSDEVDVWMIRLALLSDFAGVTGYVFARRAEIFVAFGIITAFGGLGSAVIQSSMTKHVPSEHVGSVLGATGLLHSLGRVFAPILFNGLYAATVETLPQAMFMLLASVFGLAAIASLFLRPHLFLRDETSYEHVPYEPGLESAALSEEEFATEAESLPRP